MVSASIMKKDAVLLGSVVFAPTVSFLGQPFSSLSAVSTTHAAYEGKNWKGLLSPSENAFLESSHSLVLGR